MIRGVGLPSKKSDPRERRRYHRVERRAPVIMETAGNRWKGTIINFSEIGILVHSHQTVPAGTKISIPMTRGKEGDYRLQGTVVWSRPPVLTAAGEPMPGSMGIELAAVPGEYLKAVADMRKYLASNDVRGLEPRYDVYHRVHFSSGEKFHSEYTENLSRGGMYIATTREIAPESILQIQLDIPGAEEPLQLEGRVMYRLDLELAEERGRSPGVGVQFINLNEGTQQKLNHYIRRLAVHRSTTEKHLTGPAPDSGSLNDFLVPELILNFSEQQITGSLELIRGDIQKTLYFQKGRPVYVESTLHSESLLPFLVRRGLLPLQSMEKWIALADLDEVQIGSVLIKEKLVDERDFLDAVVDNQEERITNTFPWFDGTFRVVHNVGIGGAVPIFPLQTHRMVFTGISTWYSASLVSSWMGLHEDSILHRLSFPESSVSLPAFGYQILHALWVPMTISSISEELKVSMEQLLPSIFALIISEWVKIEFDEKKVSMKGQAKGTSPPGAANALEEWPVWINEDFDRLRNLDYFALLGVNESATEAEILRAFVAMTSKYSLDPNKVDRVNDQLLVKVSQILSWIRTAHDTLLDPQARAMYQRDRATPAGQAASGSFEIEHALLMAMSAIRDGSPAQAVELLAPLVQKNRDHPTLLGWFAWARYRVDPSHINESHQMLNRAIGIDPCDPHLYYFLAEIEAGMDQWREAELAYIQTLRLQANFHEAKEGLQRARAKLAS